MDQLQPGQMLGAYRIINQIGQGGMATVYKAYQASMDRNVAIKVLPGQLADNKQFIQRFQQEARIIARLEHAHILPVFDYGESDGITYFVMRYLDAGTLKDRMQDGRPMPLDEIDRLFTQLADALSYAHSQGVIHRDLKPANVLIDAQGDLFLTDFGIAKILESSSPRLTQTDAIMGTPAYISPEQAQAQKVDQRSDIYSLGIILYEMVTGRVPFTADTPLAVILKHVSDPLPPPSTLKPDIPEAIENVILKALAKNPDDRYDTVAEFSAAWKRALKFDSVQLGIKEPPVPPSATEATVQMDSAIGTQDQFASITNTTPKSDNTARWIVGGLIGACLLFTVVGIAIVGLNWKNFLPVKQDTAIAQNTITANTSVPTKVAQNSSQTSNTAGTSAPAAGNPNDQNFAIKIGDEISNGQPGSGAGMIEAPGSRDVYTFTAQAGQVIYVHIMEPPKTSDLINIVMQDDLNSNILSSCLQCGDPGLITLDRGGTYTLIVGNDDPTNAGTGAYAIKLWDVPPPDQFAIKLDDVISKDQPGKGAGFIENPGSSDIYTFTADAGQLVYFQVQVQPQSNDLINWRLEDETGAQLFNTCLQCGDPGLITLDHGGTYTLTVGNQSGAGTGAYTVKPWSVAPPEQFNINIGDTVSNGSPGAGAGSLSTPGEHDIYLFNATAGQTLTFNITQSPSGSDLINWRLTDPNGMELFNTCLQCGNPNPVTIESDGTYTLAVGSNDSPGTGTYGFQITSNK